MAPRLFWKGYLKLSVRKISVISKLLLTPVACSTIKLPPKGPSRTSWQSGREMMSNGPDVTSATILLFPAKRALVPAAHNLTSTEHEVACEAADGAWYHAEALGTEKSLPKR